MPRRKFAGKTDIGLKRKNNEDAFFIGPDLHFCLAADGIGGAAAGAVASKIFAESTIETFTNISDRSGKEIKRRVQKAFRLANDNILKHVNQNPHAWCVSMIDTSWYMIDPTWGSGYIQNSNYIKKINNNFFKIQPNSFIKSHIPFDPLWQFLNYPITKQEFHHGTSKSKNENLYFNFIDTLKIYESQSSFNRLLSSSIRIESNGICCYLDYDNLSDIKFNIKVHYKKVDKELFNSAANQYKKGIFMLNEYIGYANKYYVPYKSDSEIRQMLEDIRITFNLALQQLEKSKYLTSSLENEIHQLKKSINQALVELKKQKNSLDKYLEIAKKYRETLSNSNEK